MDSLNCLYVILSLVWQTYCSQANTGGSFTVQKCFLFIFVGADLVLGFPAYCSFGLASALTDKKVENVKWGQGRGKMWDESLWRIKADWICSCEHDKKLPFVTCYFGSLRSFQFWPAITHIQGGHTINCLSFEIWMFLCLIWNMAAKTECVIKLI